MVCTLDDKCNHDEAATWATRQRLDNVPSNPNDTPWKDCREVAWANKAEINCYYDTYDRGGDSYVDYFVEINGTGQDPKGGEGGWAGQIMDNVRIECDRPDAWYESANMDDFGKVMSDYPNGPTEYTGVALNFHLDWKDDEMANCVKVATHTASCAASHKFVNDGCYKRNEIRD